MEVHSISFGIEEFAQRSDRYPYNHATCRAGGATDQPTREMLPDKTAARAPFPAAERAVRRNENCWLSLGQSAIICIRNFSIGRPGVAVA
jgi:hypothetical protein